MMHQRDVPDFAESQKRTLGERSFLFVFSNVVRKFRNSGVRWTKGSQLYPHLPSEGGAEAGRHTSNRLALRTRSV